ncbi:MAG: TIGR02757 family protein [Campylobacter sp.]
MQLSQIKSLLDEQLLQKNTLENLYDYPDPLQIARQHKDPVVALICALFAYGNAKCIVKFLASLDFSLLDMSDEKIMREIISANKIYRFENAQDVANIFITAKRLRDIDLQEMIICGANFSANLSQQNLNSDQKSSEKLSNLNAIPNSNLTPNFDIIHGVNALMREIYALNSYRSFGYEFFFGKVFEREPISAYKRYNMWLRWMVRKSDIDLGLFDKISPSALILPLDTHTHKVSLKIGLCSRKSYDYKAAFEITQNLRQFDPQDPIKYDFAIYRLGQSGEI